MIYMHDNDKNTDFEGAGLPAVYTVSTSTNPKHDERQIIATDFVHEHGKESYCRQVSCTVGVPGSACTYDRNGFLMCPAPIDAAVQKLVPTSL